MDQDIEKIVERAEEYSVVFDDKAQLSVESLDYMNLVINDGIGLFATEQRSPLQFSPNALYSGKETMMQE